MEHNFLAILGFSGSKEERGSERERRQLQEGGERATLIFSYTIIVQSLYKPVSCIEAIPLNS